MLSPVTDGDSEGALPTALHRLREVVSVLDLPLATPGRDRAESARRELLRQFDDYLLPRATATDAPLLAVVGGSTGAGKSTLVNSLVGSTVCRTGSIRPTTTSATLVHHPDDADWFASDRVLPGLERRREPQGDPSSIRLVASAAVPHGLALIDAPDIDSVVSANSALARHLLSAADLWIFVTTAVRYADAVPWQLLHQAIGRGTSVAFVLDRVPVDAMEEVRTDLAAMLADQGLVQSPVFALVETGLSSDGLLPVTEVARMRSWLHSLAEDTHARNVVARSTFDGTLDSLPERCGGLRDAAAAQRVAAERLGRMAEHAFSEAGRRVRGDLDEGAAFRGEVLARWQELVGTGEVLRQLEPGGSRIRRRLDAASRGHAGSRNGEDLRAALHTAVVMLLRAHAERAVETIHRGWRGSPGGAALLRDHEELRTLTAQFASNAERGVGEWQDAVLDLVREAAGSRRATSRFLAFGADGIGVMLMLVVAAAPDTAGDRRGSAVLAQRLLEAIFGEETVVQLSQKVRDRLLDVVRDVYAVEQAAFDGAVGARAGDGDELDKALAAVEEAR